MKIQSLALAAALLVSPAAQADSIGKVLSLLPASQVADDESGCSTAVRIATSAGTLVITPVTNDIFKVTTSPAAGDIPSLPSQSATLRNQCPQINLTATGDAVILASPTTRVCVDRATGLVSFYDAAGSLLLAEKEGVDNADAARRTVSFLNPGRGDIFYGAGERGHSLKLNGDTLEMYNRQNYGYTGSDPRIRQMNITVPYFASSRGYGVLFDDFTKSRLVLGDERIEYEATQAVSPLSYYFINGCGTLAGTTAGYLALTGRQELPPFWALGYITSKYGYHNQAETMGVVDTLKTRGYPVDGLVLDLYWYGVETDMGRLDWDRSKWPDPEGMLDSLRSAGVNVVAITQPYVNKKGAIDNYNYLVKNGMTVTDETGANHDVTTWVGEAGMIDVSNPATRAWYWDRYKALTDGGVAGWWGDLGEPEVHPATIRHSNGMTAEQYHNVYGNEWSRIIYEGFKQHYPDRRLMLLMRGGTAGLQRYNVFPWSTDVSRTWGGLEPQVNIMLNSGLSGLGYMSSDIGGFAVDPAVPHDSELYARWLQMGAFTPTLRTHAQLDPEPYHFPDVEKISKKYIRKRYEWLPYNYTLAFENASYGYPLARPLDFRGENPGEKYASLSDEYLWGDNVLVAPVMKKGARSRKVLFPAGEWIDLNNDRLSYKGGTTAIVRAPLDVLPMFVRRGSFIPRYELPIENVTHYDLASLAVDFYPSSDESEYVLFDDDRLSPNSLVDNDYILTTFRGRRLSDGAVEVEIESDKHPTTFDWMPNLRTITLKIKCLPRAPRTVELSVDGDVYTAVAAADRSYDAASRTLSVTLPFTGRPLSLFVK